MTTLNKLTEQVRRQYARLAGSRDDVSPLIQEREAKLVVVQVTNELLCVEPKQSAKMADISIPSCMIATYSDLTVEGAYFVKLPAYPIHLPQDMGVWSVVSSTGVAYIPITTAAWDLLGAFDEGLLEGQTGFYVEGRKVKFTAQPTATVTVKLLIIDPSTLGDNDPYPVPAEYESIIIERSLNLLLGQGIPAEKPKG